MATKKKLSFEEQLAAVEALIDRMESGEMPPEESLKRYQEGAAMLDSLEKELESANQRLTVLRKGSDEEIPAEELQ